MSEPTYSSAGVNTVKEEAALAGLLTWVGRTLAFGRYRSALDFGYFATVLDMGNNLGLALSSDGVGTKLLIAEMLGKYDTVGIDCIAMNVNDLLCVGATPISFVDYIAVEELHPEVLGEIGKGLFAGAQQSRISISGGEIAQLRDMIRGVHPGGG